MKINPTQFSFSREQRQAIIFGMIAAVLWWLVAFLLYTSSDVVRVWHDQTYIFRPVSLEDPYATQGFVHPIWIVVLIYPFRWLPLELSTLVQALIYYIALSLVILKYGGGRREILITLFSYPCLDAVLQMNVDWLVVVGMLLPAWLSGPFVLAKPQIGAGYYIGKPIRDWFKMGVLMAIIGVGSVLIWGWWTQTILDLVGEFSIGRFFNVAPSNYLGVISMLIGLVLAVWAFRRKDVPLGVLAWLFFTPYLAAYSLPLMLGMLAIKWFRLALIFSIAYWIVLVIAVGPMILQSTS